MWAAQNVQLSLEWSLLLGVQILDQWLLNLSELWFYLVTGFLFNEKLQGPERLNSHWSKVRVLKSKHEGTCGTESD